MLFSPKTQTIIQSKSKILVTGGTGFLGAYILKELINQGFAVKAIKRQSSTLPFFIDAAILNKVEWVDGDILDVVSLSDAMEGVDAVIHAAAIVSFNKQERKSMYYVNIEGTKNVVNAALDAGVKRFVYISSVAAIGRKLKASIADETGKWEDNKANTHYAISKFKAELEVWRGFGEGLNGVILNPATILGFGNWNEGSCGLFKTAFNEFKWYTGGTNGFTDVEDIANVTVALMKTGIQSERFIICNDNWPFRKLFDSMADCFGKKRPAKNATPFLSGIAWRIEKLKSWVTGQKPLLTKESARVANSATSFSNSKLLKALPGFGYRPLEETIKKACARYQSAENIYAINK